MGILDDAIRDHLDLKRRHGADPTEMEQLEHEALGPVRRGPEGSEELPPSEEAGAATYDEPAASEWSEAPADAEFVPEPEPFAEEPEFAPPGEKSEVAPPGEESEAAPPGEESGPALFDHEIDAEAPPPPADWEPLAPATEPPTDETPPAEPAVAAPPPTPDPANAAPASEPVPPATELMPGDHVEEETAEYDVEAEHARERRAAAHPEGEAHGASGESGEDVLEETPEFLQDTPDHDRLWFEQRPPKDFDFDE